MKIRVHRDKCGQERLVETLTETKQNTLVCWLCA